MTPASHEEGVLIVGLGGMGIKSAIALRSNLQSKLKTRLCALDISNQYGEYFREETGITPSDYSFLRNDEQFLLSQQVSSLEDSWAQVIEAAESNDPFALKFFQKKKIRLGMEALFPTDIQALIFVSNKALEERLKTILQEISSNPENKSNAISIIICSSLFGNTGSQALIPLLRILSKLSKDFEIDSVTSLLLDTEVAMATLWRDRRHINRSYLSKLEIYLNFWKEKTLDLIPNLYLVCQDIEESSSQKIMIESEIFQELSLRVSANVLESGFPLTLKREENHTQEILNNRGDSILRISRLSEEDCLRAREYLRQLPDFEQVWLRENY